MASAPKKPLGYASEFNKPRRPFLSARLAGTIWTFGLVLILALTAIVPFVSRMIQEFKGELPAFTRVVYTAYQQIAGTTVLLTGIVAVIVLPFVLTAWMWSGGVQADVARRREKLILALLYLLFGLAVVTVIAAVALPYVSILEKLGQGR
jgi:hypothetical protein